MSTSNEVANPPKNSKSEQVEKAPKQIIQLDDLREKPIAELRELAQKMGLQNVGRISQPALIFMLMKSFGKQGDELHSSGVLEILSESNMGYGFLRSAKASFLSREDDIYVSPKLIKALKLKPGDEIKGRLRTPKGDERYFALSSQIEAINGEAAEASLNKIPFNDLRAEFPTRWMRLEQGNTSTEDATAKIIDMFSPLGYGQRMLIPAPPKAGKTILLQQIAHAISHNHPEAHLIVLLIDERPEEVTEMERTVQGEVIAATFDEPAARHIQVAEIVISRAKRLAEQKKDVIILLDSITRLARAYNTATPASGKILTGGVDANALQRPKKFFGAARDTVEGGSITIIATALIDTGSKMDEVIYEEFKGTGNSEIHLDRNCAEKRIFPAFDLNRSGTRRDDKLVPVEFMSNMVTLRRYLQTLEGSAALEFLLDRLRSAKTVADFFKSMKSR